MIRWKKDRADLIKTLLLCLSLTITGCGVSLLGATLIDLEISANFAKTEASFIIVARAIGYATGSILGGFLSDHLPIIFIPISSLILIGSSNLFLPWMRSFWTLTPWLLLSGFGLGQLEVSANVWIINIWTTKWPPMIYSTSFSYGLGTLLAPLLAHPFLLQIPVASASDDPNNLNSTKGCLACEHPDDMRLHYAFETFAIACFVLVIFLIVLSLTGKRTRKESIAEVTSLGPNPEFTRAQKTFLKVLIFLLSQAGAGLNMGFGLLLLTYSVKSDLNFTKSQGTLLSSAYWTIYTFGRISAFIVMNWISNRYSMLLHTGLAFTAGMLLYFFYPNPVFLYAAILLMGIGLSPFTPLVFLNVRQHMRLSGHMTSIVIVGTIVGESIYPPIINHLISADPNYYSYTCMALAASSCLYFLAFDRLARITPPSHQCEGKNAHKAPLI